MGLRALGALLEGLALLAGMGSMAWGGPQGVEEGRSCWTSWDQKLNHKSFRAELEFSHILGLGLLR